jgi:hypothetical protein
MNCLIIGKIKRLFKPCDNPGQNMVDVLTERLPGPSVHPWDMRDVPCSILTQHTAIPAGMVRGVEIEVCAHTRKEVPKMVEMHVLNPVAVTKTESGDVELAPRLTQFKGMTIGLFFNQKAGGDVLLEETAHLLQQRYDGVAFKNYLGAVGHIMRHATPEQADEITRECDAVIAATAD